MTPHWHFQTEPSLSGQEFKDVLERSGLAARRPVGDSARLEAMCRNASILITCRLAEGGRLIGVARSISDLAYCTYLSDLAVTRVGLLSEKNRCSDGHFQEKEKMSGRL